MDIAQDKREKERKKNIVNKSKKNIFSCKEKPVPSDFAVNLVVPSNLVTKIIGKDNENIKSMANRSGCTFSFRDEVLNNLLKIY